MSDGEYRVRLWCFVASVVWTVLCAALASGPVSIPGVIRYAALTVGSVAFVWALYGYVVTLFIAGWRRTRWSGVWWFKDRRSKRLLGAQDLDGAWCYVHWAFCIPVYAGQTVNMPARMRAEGHEYMSFPFTHTTAIQCHPDELDQVERFLIRALRTRWFYNRTSGNTH